MRVFRVMDTIRFRFFEATLENGRVPELESFGQLMTSNNHEKDVIILLVRPENIKLITHTMSGVLGSHAYTPYSFASDVDIVSLELFEGSRPDWGLCNRRNAPSCRSSSKGTDMANLFSLPDVVVK